MSFQVTQDAYSGPLALLLELIEERRLEIIKVHLAQVADAFLAHIQTTDVPEDEIADFLVVAARLIYLKSKELLPYVRFADEEDEATRLEDRLRAYKEFVEAAKRLQVQWGRGVLFARPFIRQLRVEEFRPAKNITPQLLQESFCGLLRRLEPFFALREQRMVRTVSVEERIKHIGDALRVRARLSFREVASSAEHSADVVVTFLALLEMLRRREVTIHQLEPFHDITITSLEKTV